MVRVGTRATFALLGGEGQARCDQRSKLASERAWKVVILVVGTTVRTAACGNPETSPSHADPWLFVPASAPVTSDDAPHDSPYDIFPTSAGASEGPCPHLGTQS
jgi:hypothetical protein